MKTRKQLTVEDELVAEQQLVEQEAREAQLEEAGTARPAVKLVGTDGNVFAIIGKVQRALKKAGLHGRAAEFVERAFKAQSYGEVLAMLFDYVDPR